MSIDRADAFLRMIQRSRRGKLKIYLGYVAGVGKTCDMLQEAHRLKEAGIDIVVGLVETHGRPGTAKLVEGLEVIPRHRIEYRGVVLEEMDADAILTRKPQIVLVDELAHTNAPGSRNAKRYEDVQEILDAGIHVISTLNIQHLESLYDVVEQATGVKVRERIPDSVLTEADQIVNVDLTYQDLQERLKAGKIYPRERITTALQNFFKKTNLDQLRELTLREMAAHIDMSYHNPLQEEISATPDQVMVCLSSRGPNSEKLLRYASRFAGRLNRNWYAIYVQTPSEEPAAIEASTQRILSDTLTLAKQLGAIVFTFKGEDIAKTILQVAKEYRVGHIVIGSPGKLPFWKRLLGRRNVVDQLIENSRHVNIIVLNTMHEEPAHIPRPVAETKLPVQKVLPPAETVPELLLSHVASEESIIIWDKPLLKEELLRELASLIWEEIKIMSPALILDAVLEREKQGSTFLNEGVAFPHARLEGLAESHVAIGITRGGIADVATEKPVECVFLILTPTSRPNDMVQLLALVSKAFRERQFMKNMRIAETPGNVMNAIRNWESGR
ncbi:MAG: PTS transporter subunit EIIA, partial [Syntrophaceae bacterium]|nr:PTS transporter subunit EIIA [Syntrophaceae bacterium]